MFHHIVPELFRERQLSTKIKQLLIEKRQKQKLNFDREEQWQEEYVLPYLYKNTPAFLAQTTIENNIPVILKKFNKSPCLPKCHSGSVWTRGKSS